MNKTKGMKRTVSLLLVMVMLAAELVTPVGFLWPVLRASASTVLEAVDEIDLSGATTGELTDTGLTNYNDWKNSQNASVSIEEDADGKYINVYDNDAAVAPKFHRENLDMSTGIKTITFDLRVNAPGTNDTDASKNGAIFELKAETDPENGMGVVYPDGSIELPAVPIIPVSLTTIRLYFGDTLSIQYGSSGEVNDTGIIVPEGEWARVILVTTPADTFSLYYDNKQLVDSASTIYGRDFSTDTDLFVYSESATAGSDFDVKNYAIYTGDVSANLLVSSIGTKGTPGKEINTDLGLPYSDNYKMTALNINTSAYDTYLSKRADLAAGTIAAGGSANEVRVLDPVVVRGAIEVYVSPDGSDKNNGSKQQPLKTIQRALTFAAVLEEAGAQGVVIYLREGTYFASQSIDITAQHSGKNDIPVIISSYPNEKAVVTGGIDIAGNQFTAVTDEAVLNKLQDAIQDKIVAFDLKTLGLTDFGEISGPGPTGGPSYSVQINGQKMTLARYPNDSKIPLTGEILDSGPITQGSSAGTNMESTGVEFVMADPRPLQWENDGNIWFKGNLYAEWRICNQRVAAINEETSSIKLEADLSADGKVYNQGAKADENNTHYYYNILEELDIPGEYYVDTTNGILYLYPTCDMSTATVTYVGNTNDLISIKDAENVVINGLTIESTRGAGVRMYNCKQVIVQNCDIRHVNQGVVISGEKSGVIYSTIEYTTGQSVTFTDRKNSRNNFLQNSLIRPGDLNNEKSSEIGLYGKGHVVSHNLIQDTFAASIYLMWSTECVVEYNEIVGGPASTYDMGSIYMPSYAESYNNHVRFNYIHDTAIGREKTDPWAIYFDDASRGSFAYGNIIQNTPGGLFTNSGSEHVFADNVVVNGREATQTGVNGSDNYSQKIWEYVNTWSNYKTYYEQYKADNQFREEIVSTSPAMARLYQSLWDAETSGDTGEGFLTPRDNVAINNIIGNHGDVQLKGQTETHTIKNNTVLDEDPFVDSANGDFTLKPGVILSEGTEYTAPDMSKMGIIEYLTYEALHNLRLQDLTKIGYAFKITTDEPVDAYGALIWTDDIEGQVTVNTEGVQNKELTYDNGYYTTESDGIYAQQLDAAHYAKPYVRIGDQYIYGFTEVYSPLKYVQTIMEGTNENLKQLMIDLLNYGTYAQLYFAESNQETAPEVLIHNILTDEQKVMNWSDNLKVETPAVTKDTDKTLDTEWYGTNLNLLEAIQMNMAATGDVAGMYYWTEDAYNNAAVLDGTTASGRTTTRISNEYTIGGITGIVAQSVSDVYYVCGYDESGNLGAIRADSVAAYATRLIEKSDSTEATVNMAKALLVYGNSAMNYFAQNG